MNNPEIYNKVTSFVEITTSYFALIFTQTLLKDKCDCHLI